MKKYQSPEEKQRQRIKEICTCIECMSNRKSKQEKPKCPKFGKEFTVQQLADLASENVVDEKTRRQIHKLQLKQRDEQVKAYSNYFTKQQKKNIQKTLPEQGPITVQSQVSMMDIPGSEQRHMQKLSTPNQEKRNSAMVLTSKTAEFSGLSVTTCFKPMRETQDIQQTAIFKNSDKNFQHKQYLTKMKNSIADISRASQITAKTGEEVNESRRKLSELDDSLLDSSIMTYDLVKMPDFQSVKNQNNRFFKESSFNLGQLQSTQRLKGVMHPSQLSRDQETAETRCSYDNYTRGHVRQSMGLSHARLVDMKHSALKKFHSGKSFDQLSINGICKNSLLSRATSRTSAQLSSSRQENKKYSYFTAIEQQRSNLQNHNQWKPHVLKNAQKILVGMNAPQGIGFFKRQLNDCQVSLVMSDPLKKGGLQGQSFVKQEGYLRRQLKFDKNCKQNKWGKPVIPPYKPEPAEVEFARQKYNRARNKLVNEGFQLLKSQEIRIKLEEEHEKENRDKRLKQKWEFIKEFGQDVIDEKERLLQKDAIKQVIKKKKVVKQVLAMNFKQHLMLEMFEEFVEWLYKTQKENEINVPTEIQKDLIKQALGLPPEQKTVAYFDEHFTKQNRALRRILYGAADFQKVKKVKMMQVKVPKGQKFIAKRIDGSGKVLTSDESFRLLASLALLYDDEEQREAKKAKMAQMFSNIVRKEVSKKVFSIDTQTNKLKEQKNSFKITGKSESYQNGPFEKTYIKKAFALMNKELKISPDCDSEEFFQDGEYKSDWSSSEFDSYVEQLDMSKEPISPDLSPAKLTSNRSNMSPLKQMNLNSDSPTLSPLRQFEDSPTGGKSSNRSPSINSQSSPKLRKRNRTSSEQDQEFHIVKVAQKATEVKKKPVIREDSQNDQNQYIMEKEGKEQRFYTNIKKLSSKTDQVSLASKGGCPTASFYQECSENKIVPHPAFSKIKTYKNRLALTDYYISQEMAQSLAKYFQCAQGEEEEIKEVLLDRNGLKDKGLAILLRSLASGRKNHVKMLSIYNNEIGSETFKVLAEQYLEDITSFNLMDIKIDSDIRVKLLNQIREGAYQLKQLTLKGINLSSPAKGFEYLLQYLQSNDSIAMKHLNLSWAQLSDKQLSELMQVILEQQKNADLRDLNLSFNALNMHNPQAKKFLALLIEFIQKSDTLTHLDMSGMQLGDSALELINGAKSNNTLRMCHLSNNLLSLDLKRFLFNNLLLDYSQAKKDQKVQCPPQLTGNSNPMAKSATQQLKSVNHQFLKSVNEQMYNVHSEVNASSLESDTLILMRSMKVVQKLGNTQLAREWDLSLKENCWICNKWNFALIFFNAKRPVDDMEMVFSEDLIKSLNKTVFIDKKTFDGKIQPKKKNSAQISGSITDWKPQAMLSLKTFCSAIEKVENVFRERERTHMEYHRGNQNMKEQFNQLFGKAIIEMIKSSVPCTTNAQVLNWPENTCIEDVEQDQVQVWLGFVRPGTHQIVVKDSKQHLFTQTLIAETREESMDVQSVYAADAARMLKRTLLSKYLDPPNIFGNWKEDTFESLSLACSIDKKFQMLKRNLNGLQSAQIEKVSQKIQQNFFEIKNIFIELSAGSVQYPGVCLPRILAFFKQLGIVSLSQRVVYELFEVANDQNTEAEQKATEAFEQQKLVPLRDQEQPVYSADPVEEEEEIIIIPKKEEEAQVIMTHSNNSSDQLRRFEFIDLLVLAARKEAAYRADQININRDSDLELDVANALDDLINRKIVPAFTPATEWEGFRKNELKSAEICKFFAENTLYFSRLYRDYSEPKNGKQVLTLSKMQELGKKLCTVELKKPKSSLIHKLKLDPLEVQYCFAMSKMTVVDDQRESSYFKLKFVEMLEFIVRLACQGTLLEYDAKHAETEAESNYATALKTGLNCRQSDLKSQTKERSQVQKCEMAVKTMYEFLLEIY